jgi:SARP family transcriptional regulator, regulator of embCAB operon
MPPPIHRSHRLRSSDEERGRLQLSLLGAFELKDEDETVVLTGGTRRMLAFVALQGRPVSRAAVAEALWPEGSEAQSHASLRSAIWRLEQLARKSMSIDILELELSPQVDLDFREAKALAHRILLVDTMPSEGDMGPAAIAALSSDLLPDWYDDWAIIRAEDWRQLRLHALEALAQKLLDAGRYADALEAASEAKRADPLRESPHALTIRIHLAEGNQSEAVREFLAYRQLLHDELGIEPTAQLSDLVRPLLS